MKPISYCKKCGHGVMTKNKSLELYKCSNTSCGNILPICKECGSIMLKRSGRYGPFFGCSNYPTCSNIQKLSE